VEIDKNLVRTGMQWHPSPNNMSVQKIRCLITKRTDLSIDPFRVCKPHIKKPGNSIMATPVAFQPTGL
jgi:hypothetical protein